MESFSSRKMDFKFQKHTGVKDSEPAAPSEPESTEKTPDELGAALDQALASHNGMAICEAVKAIFSEYK